MLMQFENKMRSLVEEYVSLLSHTCEGFGIRCAFGGKELAARILKILYPLYESNTGKIIKETKNRVSYTQDKQFQLRKQWNNEYYHQENNSRPFSNFIDRAIYSPMPEICDLESLQKLPRVRYRPTRLAIQHEEEQRRLTEANKQEAEEEARGARQMSQEELAKYRYRPGREYEGYRNKNLACGLHPRALSLSDDLEQQICEWIKRKSRKYNGVTRLEVRRKARDLFGREEFRATGGWMRQFLKRHPNVHQYLINQNALKERYMGTADPDSEESENWEQAEEEAVQDAPRVLPDRGSMLAGGTVGEYTYIHRGSRKANSSAVDQL